MSQRIKPQYKWPLEIGSKPLEAELKAKRRVTYKTGKRYHEEKAPAAPSSNGQRMREHGLYAQGKKINTQKVAKPTAAEAVAMLGDALRKAGL